MTKNPAKRLGCVAAQGGEEAIKRHAFFTGKLDWEALERRQVKPPFKPKVVNLRDTSNFDKDFTNMPVAFTPIEAVIVKAINQEEFKEFSYQNPDWRCLERGEIPKDDANDGRRALRDDLSINLKQPLPMTPISSPQSPAEDTVSSTITVVKTDHTPIPHIENIPTATSNSISSSNSTSSTNAQPKSMINNNNNNNNNNTITTNNRSPMMNRSTTDQTDM
jgi:hypothetical protein